jgi:hypothetical protein
MKLVFDIDSVDIELYPGPATDFILKCFKHLQHVPVPMRDWDYPFYFEQHTRDYPISQLCNFAKPLGITVDPAQCQQQSYLNDLHFLYEKNSNGKSDWLDFHESIHLVEKIDTNVTSVRRLLIDYRELAGPLLSKFDCYLKDQCILDLQPGDVTVGWSELGKTPYRYWKTQEPNDINRIRDLIKPYLTFRPRLTIRLDPVIPHSAQVLENFNNWWAQYESDWCRHWNSAPWTTEHMFGRIVVGRVQNFDKFLQLLQSNRLLKYVTL